MLYPREFEDGILVSDDQMVGCREHLLNEHRTLFLTGIIGQRCLTCGQGDFELPNILMALDSLSHEPIRLVITSPGGDLDSTFAFYDAMKICKSPIETWGRYCASAAALLLAAGRKRYLSPHSKVMLHKPWGRHEGDSRDWEIQGLEMKKYEKSFIDALLDCGVTKTYTDVLGDIDRDLWLDPQETITYGLADEIMTPTIMEEWLKVG